MQNFEFYGRTLSGRQEPTPQWKRAVAMVNGTLGEAVGQMYVEKYFPEENKVRMLDLVKNLQTALGERIMGLEWMSDETKEKAMEKLNTFTVKIGYPDKWRDYTALEIDPTLTYYANIQRAAKFEQDYSLSFLGKPVDKDKWYMTPQTVNAYYNPATNEICFPAGILQYPFFDMNADDAFNYGAIGVVIGHEMTHGFDDQGSQFDKDGNLINWWTEEDRARFEERTKVMEEYFNAIEVAPGVHANGKFTLGENIADHERVMSDYRNINIRNKRATFDYEIIEQFTAGIVLVGTEIKSIRLGKASLTDCYCYFDRGELYIRGVNINEYKWGTYNNHIPKRDRKLLLNRRELNKLERALQDKGLTVVGLRMFISDKGYAKVVIGLARGRKNFDKREYIKDKDARREMDRAMKR